MKNKQKNTIDNISAVAIPVLKKYNVAKAGIFGSTARNESTSTSDIDFLIEFDEDASVSLIEVADLKIALEEALDNKVDIVEYDALKPALASNIMADERRIYEKK